MVVWTLILNKVCSFKYGVKVMVIGIFTYIILNCIDDELLVVKMMDKLDLTKHDLHKMIKDLK